jgi:hypothetical protein
MRIVIQPPEDGNGFDRNELQRALDALDNAAIRIECGAVVRVEGTTIGVVVLRAKADARHAPQGTSNRGNACIDMNRWETDRESDSRSGANLMAVLVQLIQPDSPPFETEKVAVADTLTQSVATNGSAQKCSRIRRAKQPSKPWSQATLTLFYRSSTTRA